MKQFPQSLQKYFPFLERFSSYCSGKLPACRYVHLQSAIVLLILPVFLMCLPSCQSQKTEPVAQETKKEEPKGPDFFEDVTTQSKELKTFLCRNGEDKNHYTILETVGSGLGVLDFDKDGLLDLLVIGGGDFGGDDKKDFIGYPCGLFKNMGGWKFQDVTKELLPKQNLFYSHGVAVADYDRDGWPDFLVTGYGQVALYRNVVSEKGQRQFVEATKEAGLQTKEHFWNTSAAFGDLDGDGWPDLYVCRYVDWSWQNNPKCFLLHSGMVRDVCHPRKFNAQQHALYRNNGKGAFVDVSAKAGLRIEANDPDKGKDTPRSYCGKGLGALILDIDGDQRPDIYVANDGTDNFLYFNKSKPGEIRLEEAGRDWGVATDLSNAGNASMGVDAADIDGSGEPALWVTNFEYEMHALYRMHVQKQKKSFFFSTPVSGISAIGQIYVGWGTGFLDLDNDGWQDLVVTNGHVYRNPANNNLAQKGVLLRNQGKGEGKFKPITNQGGSYFAKTHRGRGLAIGDLNNDGLPDLAINHINEPPSVLKNIFPGKNNWLGIQLEREEFADVVGAKAVLQVGKHKVTRFQKGGGSFLSARDPRLLFGLGPSGKAGKLTVYWPLGEPRVEVWDNLETNRYHKVVQGTGKKG